MSKRGGKSFQDREKASKLRSDVMDSLMLVMKDDPKVAGWSDYKKRIIEKMATNVLPRLNEHTGADGADLKITFDPVFGAKK